MLQVQNGRQFNLAAKTVRTFLAEKSLKISHSEALALVARLTGHANYEAANASLTGVAKGISPCVQTWRHLAHAIGTLSAEQLDMPVQVSEGCDSDGNSSFSTACELMLANSDRISAGVSIFADNQPVLRVEELNAELESDDALRVELQFEVATGEPGGLATYEIKRQGLTGAVESLNAEYGINISLGKFVAYSAGNKGFWNADFGYVREKECATGYASKSDIQSISVTETLTPILYTEAVDINLDSDD